MNTGDQKANQEVSIKSFLSTLDLTDFWSYDGSLTTPPCTEGIKWSVLRNVQPISKRQLKRFTDLWSGNMDYAEGKGNNRVIQPLNGRKVFMSNQKKDSSFTSQTSVLYGFFGLSAVAIGSIYYLN